MDVVFASVLEQLPAELKLALKSSDLDDLGRVCCWRTHAHKLTRYNDRALGRLLLLYLPFLLSILRFLVLLVFFLSLLPFYFRLCPHPSDSTIRHGQ